MKAYLETYGCQMNINESDVLAKRLVEAGYTLVGSEDEADLILLNTCSIRDHAEQKIWSRLGTLRKLRQSGKCSMLGVTGCMAQRLGKEVLTRAPYVDLVVGSGAYPRLLELLTDKKKTGKAKVDVGYARDFEIEDRPHLAPGAIKTFLTIIRGCNNACHYCIVPRTRGRERSKPIRAIRREAEWCVAQGVKEITLLGQNVNHYRDGRLGLADCLLTVADVPGLERVRFTTSHPAYMTDDVLAAMGSHEKIMPHLHLPLQSGSDRVLAAMNREYDYPHYRRLVARARERVPGIALSTDIIVGYPGETEEDFQATLRALEEIRFDSGFLFQYSARKGTVAAAMEEDVAPEVKRRRLNDVIQVQRRISDEQSARFLGKTVQVLVEGRSSRDRSLLTGRTREFKNAMFPGDPSWVGSVKEVRVTATRGVTLRGVPLQPKENAAAFEAA